MGELIDARERFMARRMLGWRQRMAEIIMKVDQKMPALALVMARTISKLDREGVFGEMRSE